MSNKRQDLESGPFDRYIEPPPRLVATAEPLPHLGGLALVPHRGELPDEMEIHPVERLADAFEDGRAQEILKNALGMPKVRDRLGRSRWVPIGVSQRGETAKGEARTYLVVAYDYAADVAVEITIDERGDLLGTADERYQPPPTQAEIERAIELARLDERLIAKISGLVAMAIPFAPDADVELANHRIIEVLFGCRAERLPRHRAWVDLSTERVLHAGGTSDCCGQTQENRS
jgi:hypothetical protein